jgi:hypothetical protein
MGVEAVALLKEMKDLKLAPNEHSYTAAVEACSAGGHVRLYYALLHCISIYLNTLLLYRVAFVVELFLLLSCFTKYSIRDVCVVTLRNTA